MAVVLRHAFFSLYNVSAVDYAMTLQYTSSFNVNSFSFISCELVCA